MRHLLSLIFLIALSNSAYANWQFTNWGMTPEVTKASGGKTEATSSKEKRDFTITGVEESVLLKAPYASGTLRFVAYFGFDPSNKLVTVTLKSLDHRGEEIFHGLSSKCGDPHNQTKNMLSWYAEWRTGNETISFNAMPTLKPTSVSVNYIARNTSNNSGL
jgi:hypothetical protein